MYINAQKKEKKDSCVLSRHYNLSGKGFMQKRITIAIGALSLVCIAASACAPAGSKSNQKGLKAYSEGDYQNAVYLFKQAITQEPSQQEYYCNLGQAYCAQGYYEKAIESFDQANQLESSFYSFRGLGLAYSGLEEYEKAIECYNQAMETVDEMDSFCRLDVVGYRAKAKTAFGDYEGALKDYNELIEEKYRLRDIYQLVGNVYLLMNDTDMALRSYQKCLDIDNRNYEGYLTMAEALEKSGEDEACMIVLNAALEVIPYESEDWCYRGRVYLELDEVDKAFSAFEESYNKGYSKAGYYLGYCYELQGQSEEAIHLYQEQLKNDSYDAGLYNQLASCMVRQGEYQDALIMIEKGMQTADESQVADFLWNESICYEKMGNYDMAIEKLMDYLEQYPSDQDARRELAFLYSR